MRKYLLGSALVLFQVLGIRSLALPETNSTPGSMVVDVGYAQYQGRQTRNNTMVYLGIPYAEPPLGPLRFQKTVPLDTKRITEQAQGAVVDATQYANFCIQGALCEHSRLCLMCCNGQAYMWLKLSVISEVQGPRTVFMWIFMHLSTRPRVASYPY